MNDDAVNGMEQTTPENSQTPEENNPEITPETSSGDVITSGSEQEEVSQALDEVKTDRGVNRVQSLANRLKDRNEYIQRLEEQLQTPQAYSSQSNQQPVSVQDLQLMRINAKLSFIEEDKAWERAEALHPELKENKQLNDLVYSKWRYGLSRGESSDPAEIVTSIKDGLLKQAKSEATATAEKQILQKQSASGGATRNSPVSSDEDGYRRSRNRFKDSGSVSDLESLL